MIGFLARDGVMNERETATYAQSLHARAGDSYGTHDHEQFDAYLKDEEAISTSLESRRSMTMSSPTIRLEGT